MTDKGKRGRKAKNTVKRLKTGDIKRGKTAEQHYREVRNVAMVISNRR